MTELTYSGDEWREAYDRAEEYEFDTIDSREQGGELPGVVAELCEDETGHDEGLLYAAITVASDLAESYTRSFLLSVIRRWDEQAEIGVPDRVLGYVAGHRLDSPVDGVADLTAIVGDTLQAHERLAHDGASGCWFLFNVTGLTTDAKE
ncbi:hypothetical protein ACFU99_05835 [Streptomyces sp. NPDC057654]|uniref:hypothetical protein n=1 Tax=Streptomyces sp. NPDC057654 TaxID=3346196 RepID=UPI00369AB1D5